MSIPSLKDMRAIAVALGGERQILTTHQGATVVRKGLAHTFDATSQISDIDQALQLIGAAPTPPTSAADAALRPLFSSDEDLLSAPSLHIQVYLAAKLRSWPSDAAFEAAGMAEKDFGKEPCLTAEALRHVLGEALRTDTDEDEDNQSTGAASAGGDS